MPLEQARPYIDFGKIFNKEGNLNHRKKPLSSIKVV